MSGTFSNRGYIVGKPSKKTNILKTQNLTYACNHFKSSSLTSEIVPGEDFDMLKLNLKSKTFKSFVSNEKSKCSLEIKGGYL